MTAKHYTKVESSIKDHWIEGLNNGGNHEFLLFVRAMTPFQEACKVIIKDIYHEGFLLHVSNTLDGELKPYFYDFPQFEENPVDAFAKQYMGFLSSREEAKDFKANRQLVLLQKSIVAHSFIRLRLQYSDMLPAHIKPAFVTVLTVAEGEHRAYTYRRVNEQEKWIDIDFFTHGQTPTYEWLAQLENGQSVLSVREKNESVDHLNDGHVVLCGDETAFPAIAALLESWKNPQAPIVFLEMLDARDIVYFDDCSMPKETVIHSIKVNSQEDYGQGTQQYLSLNPQKIDKVWGAFNTIGMKRLRQFFEKEYHLSSANMVVRVYWNHQRKIKNKD